MKRILAVINIICLLFLEIHGNILWAASPLEPSKSDSNVETREIPATQTQDLNLPSNVQISPENWLSQNQALEKYSSDTQSKVIELVSQQFPGLDADLIHIHQIRKFDSTRDVLDVESAYSDFQVDQVIDVQLGKSGPAFQYYLGENRDKKTEVISSQRAATYLEAFPKSKAEVHALFLAEKDYAGLSPKITGLRLMRQDDLKSGAILPKGFLAAYLVSVQLADGKEVYYLSGANVESEYFPSCALRADGLLKERSPELSSAEEKPQDVKQPEPVILPPSVSEPDPEKEAATQTSGQDASLPASEPEQKDPGHIQNQLLVKFKESAAGFLEGFQRLAHESKNILEQNHTALNAIFEKLEPLASPLSELFIKSGVWAIEKLFGKTSLRNESAEQQAAQKQMDQIYVLNFDEALGGMEEALGLFNSKGLSDWIEYAAMDETIQTGALDLSPEVLGDRNLSDYWGLEKIHAQDAWKLFDINHNGIWDPEETKPGEGVTVAVIDTGIDFNHPDLFDNIWVNAQEISWLVGDRNGNGKIDWLDADFNGDERVTLSDLDGLVKTEDGSGKTVWTVGLRDGKLNGDELSIFQNGKDDDGNGYMDDIMGWDFTRNTLDPTDKVNHGTHVAGTIAARGDQTQSALGVAPWATLMNLNVFGSKGATSTSWILKAMYYAVNQGAQVINMSLGGPHEKESYGYRLLNDAVNFAYTHGSAVIVAAGNDRLNSSFYSPANTQEAISVTAVASDDLPANFSNYGALTDIAAPGVGIRSTIPGNKYAKYRGTSMAAPHVSGVAALIYSRYGASLFADEVRQRILHSATPLNSGQYYGEGIVDAYRALDSELSPTARGNIMYADEQEIGMGENYIPLQMKGVRYKLEWGFVLESDPDPIQARSIRGESYFQTPKRWITLKEDLVPKLEPGANDALVLLHVNTLSYNIPLAYLAYSQLRLTVFDEQGKSYTTLRKVYYRDAVAPTVGLQINDRDLSTTSREVTLKLDARDDYSGVYQMQFSDDGILWSEWEAFQPSKKWTLPDLKGERRVFVRVKDAFDNMTETSSSIQFVSENDDLIKTWQVSFSNAAFTVYEKSHSYEVEFQGKRLSPNADKWITVEGYPPFRINFENEHTTFSPQMEYLINQDGESTVFVVDFERIFQVSGNTLQVSKISACSGHGSDACLYPSRIQEIISGNVLASAEEIGQTYQVPRSENARIISEWGPLGMNLKYQGEPKLFLRVIKDMRNTLPSIEYYSETGEMFYLVSPSTRGLMSNGFFEQIKDRSEQGLASLFQTYLLINSIQKNPIKTSDEDISVEVDPELLALSRNTIMGFMVGQKNDKTLKKVEALFFPHNPYPGIEISVSGQSRLYEVHTDASGQMELRRLIPASSQPFLIEGLTSTDITVQSFLNSSIFKAENGDGVWPPPEMNAYLDIVTEGSILKEINLKTRGFDEIQMKYKLELDSISQRYRVVEVQVRGNPQESAVINYKNAKLTVTQGKKQWIYYFKSERDLQTAIAFDEPLVSIQQIVKSSKAFVAISMQDGQIMDILHESDSGKHYQYFQWGSLDVKLQDFDLPLARRTTQELQSFVKDDVWLGVGGAPAFSSFFHIVASDDAAGSLHFLWDTQREHSLTQWILNLGYLDGGSNFFAMSSEVYRSLNAYVLSVGSTNSGATQGGKRYYRIETRDGVVYLNRMSDLEGIAAWFENQLLSLSTEQMSEAEQKLADASREFSSIPGAAARLKQSLELWRYESRKKMDQSLADLKAGKIIFKDGEEFAGFFDSLLSRVKTFWPGDENKLAQFQEQKDKLLQEGIPMAFGFKGFFDDQGRLVQQIAMNGDTLDIDYDNHISYLSKINGQQRTFFETIDSLKTAYLLASIQLRIDFLSEQFNAGSMEIYRQKILSLNAGSLFFPIIERDTNRYVSEARKRMEENLRRQVDQVSSDAVTYVNLAYFKKQMDQLRARIQKGLGENAEALKATLEMIIQDRLQAGLPMPGQTKGFFDSHDRLEKLVKENGDVLTIDYDRSQTTFVIAGVTTVRTGIILEFPVVDWVQAPSNSQFQFTENIASQNGSSSNTVLVIKDTWTNEIKELPVSVQMPQTSFSPVRDISPNGEWVVYGIRGRTKYEDEIIICHRETREIYRLQGSLAAIEFQEKGLVIVYQDGFRDSFTYRSLLRKVS